VKLTNVTSRTLSSIVADPVVGAWGLQAYVGSSKSGSLLVIRHRRWWQIALAAKRSEEEHMHAVGTATLALSRREPLLYLTAPDSQFLFSLDLSAVRSSPPPSNKVRLSEITSVLVHHHFLTNNFLLLSRICLQFDAEWSQSLTAL